MAQGHEDANLNTLHYTYELDEEMARTGSLTKVKLASYAIWTAVAFFGGSPHHPADAGIVMSELFLEVSVNTTRFGGQGDSADTVVPIGSTRSIQVQSSSDSPVGSRSATAAGVATVNNAASGTARLDGTFRKLPVNSSGGFAATRSELVYRFETDTAGTLFLETANAASFTGNGDFGTKAPRWDFNGKSNFSSGLNTTDNWSIAIAPGTHELTMHGVSQGTSWGQRSDASGEFSTVFNWGFDSLPGTLGNPILPTQTNAGDFGFDIVTTDDIRFYDPVIATGYDYIASDIPFASVLIPEPLPGGDSEFQLLVGSDTFDLIAGEMIDLTTIDPNGVREFGIRGIDPDEQLDPDDPTAFITGLSFVQGGAASSFHMTAVTTNSNVVPEPSSMMVWSLLMGIGILRTRRLLRS